MFDVEVLSAKRGEVDGSHAPQALDLHLAVWTNTGGSQNSFNVKGSVFDDAVKIEPGAVGTGGFDTPAPPWYFPAGDTGFDLLYKGTFTTVSANLGAGNDQYDTFTDFRVGPGIPVDQFRPVDIVWGGTGDDLINTGYGNDRLFGDNGSGAWLNQDPLAIGGQPGNDRLNADQGADWIEGNGDTGSVGFEKVNNLIINGSFEQFDHTPGPEVISHQGGKWFTLNEVQENPAQVDNLPGWEAFNGAIELQTNAVGGLPAFDGLIKLELDSHPDFGQNSFTILTQGIAPLPGVSYHLSFAYAPRSSAPTGSSAFDFSFNNFVDGDPGNIVASFANDDPGWHLFEADIIGTGFAQLTFSPAGPLDTLGALIDDVRLVQEPTLNLSLAGDIIDCGTRNLGKPNFLNAPDSERDIVNFNAGDGFDIVHSFGAGIFETGSIPIENVDDVLRIENVGTLTTEVINSTEGRGTLVQNGAGSVFLVGVTTPLTQSVDGNYLLLFDAA